MRKFFLLILASLSIYAYAQSSKEEPMFIDCGYCKGTGKMTCYHCMGRGSILQNQFIMFYGSVLTEVECIACSRTGKLYCMWCNGSGRKPNLNHPYAHGGGAVPSHSGGSSSSSSSSLCKYCGGGGGCSSCKGTGIKYNSYSMSNDKCPSCNGSGRCFNCRGSGRQR